MPTINITNGTFNGTITYDDVTPTPPDNPTGAPVPDVTEFSGANNAKIKVDDHVFLVENANQPYCLTNPDSQTLRFELRSGDVWSGSERTELEGQIHYPPNTDFGYAGDTDLHVAYEFMLEKGNPNTAAWLVAGQFHGGTGGNPPFIFTMVGEKLQIAIRTPPNVSKILWTDPNPIERGRYYLLEADINFAAGKINVKRDGIQIASHNGPIGSSPSDRHYWKMGIYREKTPNDTQAARYRNFVISP